MSDRAAMNPTDSQYPRPAEPPWPEPLYQAELDSTQWHVSGHVMSVLKSYPLALAAAKRLEQENDRLQQELAAAQAACGELRQIATAQRDLIAGQLPEGWDTDTPTNPRYVAAKVELLKRIDHALLADAGRGWVSPAEHAKVQAEAAAMRCLLASLRWSGKVIDGPTHYSACPVCKMRGYRFGDPEHADGCEYQRVMAGQAGQYILDRVRRLEEALREVCNIFKDAAERFGSKWYIEARKLLEESP